MIVLLFSLIAVVMFLLITVLLLAVLATFIGAERFKMIQKSTGKIKSVKRGFSYTYLFFGSLVPLFRGHIGGFFLSLFLAYHKSI